MKKRENHYLQTGVIMIVLFMIWTIMIQTIDVRIAATHSVVVTIVHLIFVYHDCYCAAWSACVMPRAIEVVSSLMIYAADEGVLCR